MRFPYVKFVVCMTPLVLAACESNPNETIDVTPQVLTVAGDAVSDTVQAALSQPLEAEVRDQDGRPAARVPVRFEVLNHTDATRAMESAVTVCTRTSNRCTDNSQALVDTSDVQGKVQLRVRLGTVAGGGRVHVSVPEFGIADTARYTILPGLAVRLRASTADTTLEIGTAAPLRARLLDRFANALGDAPSISAGAGDAFRLNVSAGIITAAELGVQWLYWRYGNFVDSTQVRVLPSGRLVVWTGSEVRLINLDGKAAKTVVTGVTSQLGVFPRFDATRQRITLHSGGVNYETPNRAIVIDTTGQSRRDYHSVHGSQVVTAVRQIADGTLFIVGRRAQEAQGIGSTALERTMWSASSPECLVLSWQVQRATEAQTFLRTGRVSPISIRWSSV